MADDKRRSGTRPVRESDAERELGERPKAMTMSRSIGQLLFTYLPGRAVDWDDGLAIVSLDSPRLRASWDGPRKQAVLDEVAHAMRGWEAAGGTISADYPRPERDPGRITVGTPDAVEATVLGGAMVCTRCDTLSFEAREAAARGGGQASIRCPNPKCAQPTMRQFPFVFVHGCGELQVLEEWMPSQGSTDGGIVEKKRPIRCQRCQKSLLAIPARSDRIRDISIKCTNCGDVVMDRIVASCQPCIRAYRLGEQRTPDGRPADPAHVLMRATRYSATNTYSPQSISFLPLDQTLPVAAPDPEVERLQRLLPTAEQPLADAGAADRIEVLLAQVKRATDPGEKKRLMAAIARAARDEPAPSAAQTAPDVTLQDEDLFRGIRESVTFRTSVNTRSLPEVAESGAGPSSLRADAVRAAFSRLGLRCVELVFDLPVVQAAFGFTRRSYRPTYVEEIGNVTLSTTLRPLKSLSPHAAQYIGDALAEGTTPILARDGRHQGMFVSLEPERVIAWLTLNGVELPAPNDLPLLRILAGLEPCDRYHNEVFSRPIRRYVFGLVHTLSHAVMRVAARYAGLERTSVSEYLFLPLLGSAVYDNSSHVQLGGFETLAKNSLESFSAALEDDAMACLYDTECIDHRGACHGCVHAPEISCRFFNHGLSRALLLGGHAPWASGQQSRVIGYWEM